MNKVVREHYPAAKLPEELREGIDPKANVTITVEIEETSSERHVARGNVCTKARRLRVSARGRRSCQGATG